MLKMVSLQSFCCSITRIAGSSVLLPTALVVFTSRVWSSGGARDNNYASGGRTADANRGTDEDASTGGSNTTSSIRRYLQCEWEQ